MGAVPVDHSEGFGVYCVSKLRYDFLKKCSKVLLVSGVFSDHIHWLEQAVDGNTCIQCAVVPLVRDRNADPAASLGPRFLHGHPAIGRGFVDVHYWQVG